MGLYDAYLATRHRLHDAEPPAHVALVLTERDLLADGAFDTLSSAIGWAFEYGAERVTVSVSVLDRAVAPTLVRELRRLDIPAETVVRGPEVDGSPEQGGPDAATESDDAPVRILVGLGGKAEFAGAVRELASDVAAGEITPEAIDETDVAERLLFPEEPDLVIKTGAERLSDFAIWQSVYAELYFTDVNWRDFRRREYLRAVLDYQNRQRRFGR
ncbi:di-trans-poly-cis-decaprenylcistransferase [Halorubrum sp. E3]|uniref:Di-trans-poly-cis-decaprenylcistransferase n=6 Tax=Halorubrum distributum TaxID=29283 RepID=M0EPJ0_9EURY|nr:MULTISPECIES: undecaprenyl diphosphate synthase family protein [Halorubrum distributum group]OYR81105.1 di-trans-poly-cis-decaprenylcistransferase [Halorubrum sp. E3]PHQ44897.1 di-trans-poly-cis-decaprenylcistransferase [Halorubrum sp. C3]ELZ32115.1 Di-trans-poly-cis-decaprenylcistransferase [Halorubrum terrestre JCM 10247]ELZ49721.1 Di-trans-poly-cis-decaprenylcistransferase [Halorubrum distributum JCM 9100]ELZ56935.1 Di-trans-poly-cis-decaprenylcistransferase [Halorubrum distributum JCM 1